MGVIIQSTNKDLIINKELQISRLLQKQLTFDRVNSTNRRAKPAKFSIVLPILDRPRNSNSKVHIAKGHTTF